MTGFVGNSSSFQIINNYLLLYHNTGAEQIGYRYLLDIAAPLCLLMTDGLREKVSRLFKLLTIISICVSFAGIYWWYLGRV